MIFGYVRLKSLIYVSFYHFLFRYSDSSTKILFLICFFVFLSSSHMTCFCHHLVKCVVCIVLVSTHWFSSSCCSVFLCIGDSNGKSDSIKQIHQVKSWLLINCRTLVICIIVIIELSNVQALRIFIMLLT